MRELLDDPWVLTDLHFFHANLVRRGNRPADYQERTIMNWKQNIAQEEVVVCLGDVAMGQQGAAHDIIRELPGFKILTKGNHDKQKDAWYESHGWDEVHKTLLINHKGRPVLLSHYPQPDGPYSVNVHGHFHDDEHRAEDPEMVAIRNPKHRLLALEAVDYMPVRLSDILSNRIVQRGLPLHCAICATFVSERNRTKCDRCNIITCFEHRDFVEREDCCVTRRHRTDRVTRLETS